MLSKTSYFVDLSCIETAKNLIPSSEFRTTINQPTGDIFYDPWQIKDEFKNTVWEELINTVKEPVGEARIIILKPQSNYHAHADIDDRFHLNIQGEYSYLIDLDNNQLHALECNGIWYSMDAGKLHTACNFGRIDRVQLVIRKLLKRSTLNDLISIQIHSNIPSLDDSRFIFDNRISPWLNRINKQGLMANFKHSQEHAQLDIDPCLIPELEKIILNDFTIQYQ